MGTLKYASAVLLRWCFPGRAGSHMWLKLAHVVATPVIIDISNAITRVPENGTPVRGGHEELFSPFDLESWARVFDRAINHFGAMFAQISAVMTSLDAVSGDCNPYATAEI